MHSLVLTAVFLALPRCWFSRSRNKLHRGPSLKLIHSLAKMKRCAQTRGAGEDGVYFRKVQPHRASSPGLMQRVLCDLTDPGEKMDPRSLGHAPPPV